MRKNARKEGLEIKFQLNIIKNLSLSKKIIAGLLIAGLIFLSIGIYAVTTISNTQRTLSSQLNDGMAKLRINDSIKTIVLTQQNLTLTFISSKDETLRKAAIDEFRYYDRYFTEEIIKLNNYLTDEEKPVFEDIKHKHEVFSYLSNAMFSLHTRGNELVVAQIEPNSKASTEKLVESSNQMSEDTIQALNDVQANGDANIKNALRRSSLYGLLGLVLSIFVSFYVVREIQKPVKGLMEVTRKVALGDLRNRAAAESRDEIGELAQSFNLMIDNLESVIKDTTHKSDQLLASSESIRKSTQEYAGLAENISASFSQASMDVALNADGIREMSYIIDETNANVANIAAVTEKISEAAGISSQRAEDGGLKLDTAVSHLLEIDTNSRETNVILSGLALLFEEVAQITSVTKKFAEQTNLLALNAEIEAAHAGDMGKGFSVIASEVRKLAQASTENSHRIEKKLEEVSGFSRKVTEVINKSNLSIANTKTIVEDLSKSLKEIIANTKMEALEIKNIYNTIEDLRKASNSMAGKAKDIGGFSLSTSNQISVVEVSIKEQTSFIKELHAQAESLDSLAVNLQGVVSKFTVGGSV
ncbi:methyl-accepting chemotaxis protein [Desulfosporosinus youngiae]|uniref:Methyl-accepting chemotaxis protein n=1 Tax=Desulfosporosinus youngiae DSM 17734 TaxID=768710 RepID=H5Y5P5_9FIRM|nr:methyl-accepting chemotaxis protein [Desulfosporosinus youngiae]EHQ90771.1 methyl-accepting chemotaxis protein [Desulfosporosinus youngiae DSM 17734]